jgi:hypothetical protein
LQLTSPFCKSQHADRRVLGPTEKALRDLGKLYNEQLHGLRFSPKTIRVTKARSIRCAEGRGTYKKRRNAQGVFVGTPQDNRIGLPGRTKSAL